MGPFYNTIQVTGLTLIDYRIKAEYQDERILAIFQVNKRNLTPFEVSAVYNALYPPAPITSIRRAITNLTEQGKLIKSTEMRMGEYGKSNFTWVIVDKK